MKSGSDVCKAHVLFPGKGSFLKGGRELIICFQGISFISEASLMRETSSLIVLEVSQSILFEVFLI